MRVLEELVSIEQYHAMGVVSDNLLLVAGFREGALNVYAFDVGARRLSARLNRGRVDDVAYPRPGAGRVVALRDVGGGREQHILLLLDPRRPGVEEPLVPEMKPIRIISAVDSGDVVVFTGSTESEVGIYAARRGEVWKVADAPGIPIVTDFDGKIVAGLLLSPREQGRAHLLIASLGDGEARVVRVEGGSATYAVIWKGLVLYGFEGAQEADLRAVDPNSLEHVEPGVDKAWLKEYRPATITYLSTSPRGDLVIIARRKGRSRIVLNGRLLGLPEGNYLSALVLGDRLYATHTSLKNPPRIVEASLDGSRYEVVLEGSRPAWLDEAIRSVEYVEVESSDGLRVPTFVVRSGRAEQPGPTVVLVHGGPFAEYGDEWVVSIAALASLGFNLVLPNYRGSTGYGDEWRTRIIGDPCGGELEDIVSAAEWARKTGIASKLYIMGYSYGGYMTLCALTRKPKVFEAGVAGAAVADWKEMYELSDAVFKSFIELLFGGRREDLWRERSPITHVDGLEKPLCIIHPQNDTRTPLSPILRFITEASKRGKRFEAHIVPDMGHVINTVEDAVKILLPALIFLLRAEYGPPGAPNDGKQGGT